MELESNSATAGLNSESEDEEIKIESTTSDFSSETTTSTNMTRSGATHCAGRARPWLAVGPADKRHRGAAAIRRAGPTPKERLPREGRPAAN